MKIGVIGGGQLAQMLALAAYPLGLQIICLEPSLNCPASLVTKVITGEYTDQAKLLELADQVDVITYEFENITIEALAKIQEIRPIYPPLPALKISQDRLLEKDFFTQLKIPTTQYHAVSTLAELNTALNAIGLPAVVKTRRFGYDGKGQYVLRTQADMENAWANLNGQPLIVENLVSFDNEVSLIAVRSLAGEIRCYPLTLNEHRNGILAISTAPYESEALSQKAQSYLTRIMQELNYVGILAVEFFQKDGELFANEMAPRVHNSGHWTIEGAATSQFENHVRAVADLPLGATNPIGKSIMFNLIGSVPDINELLNVTHAHLHLYGKEPRAGRKLGHVTLHSDKDSSEYFRQLKKLITD